MITRMTLEEKEMVKNMIANLSKRWAKRLNVTEETLTEIFSEATVEIYMEKPFTTAIVKKTVNGRHIRGAGFLKYNLNDEKTVMNPKNNTKHVLNPWDETKGKMMSLSRAYHNFIQMMIEEKALTTNMSKSQQRRLNVQAVVEPTSESTEEKVLVSAAN